MVYLKREYGIKVDYRGGQVEFINFEEFGPAESAYHDWSRDLSDDAVVSFVVRNVVVADWVEAPVKFLGERFMENKEDVVAVSTEQQELFVDLESSLAEVFSDETDWVDYVALSAEETLQRFEALNPEPVAAVSPQEPVSGGLNGVRSADMKRTIEFLREAISDVMDSYEAEVTVYDLKVAILSAAVLVAPVHVVEEAFELLVRTGWVVVDDAGVVTGCG